MFTKEELKKIFEQMSKANSSEEENIAKRI